MSTPPPEQQAETASGMKVALVDDAPAASDAFLGHAHQSVATAIARLVETELGGRVIGLEGAWGSGKSTIVGLIKSHFDIEPTKHGAQETRVSVFDAWSHQGDPLRRTFLEALLDDVADWLPSKSTVDDYKARFTGKCSTSRDRDPLN
jgi:ATPase subunit of ABC transporter with duplicated ATPase domains